MIETIYRDLGKFGLPLISPGQPSFDVRLAEIRNLPGPFAPDMESVSGRSAILENQSEQSVIALRYLWRYSAPDGTTRTSSHMNLGSSRQMDVLTGREKAGSDTSVIVPGSSRLITEGGMFGDNRDVSLAPPATSGRGWGFAGGAGRAGGRGTGVHGSDHDAVRIELELDLAIFEDGLCVGADESGVRQRLVEEMGTQKEVADQIARELRGGATTGRIFEMLRPLARFRGPRALSQGGHHHLRVLSMFATAAIHHLINADDEALATWFEAAAAISPLHLHAPSE